MAKFVHRIKFLVGGSHCVNESGTPLHMKTWHMMEASCVEKNGQKLTNFSMLIKTLIHQVFRKN